MSGQCVNKFQPSKWSLGVKTVEWSPSGQVLAVGSFDQKVFFFFFIYEQLKLKFLNALSSNLDSLIKLYNLQIW